ncbi:hypothetical protein QJS66_20735 [Kocuria rhizophila]|nr:hypothetical protein QJS66_20735 [Kocuria rhizophila]
MSAHDLSAVRRRCWTVDRGDRGSRPDIFVILRNAFLWPSAVLAAWA